MPSHRGQTGGTERLPFRIQPQPDDFTCGPTCLKAIYDYWGRDVALDDIVAAVERLPAGGTADVFLANHALENGFRVTICTFNLRIFDPTWFRLGACDLAEKLRRQREAKADDQVLVRLSDGYLRFLELGGDLRLVDLSAHLLRSHLRRGMPILTGLSSTFLYRAPREFGPRDDDDDIRGEPQGHFVVLYGYEPSRGNVLVADPFQRNPMARHYYEAPVERAIGAILLGVLTHDANLVVIEPKKSRFAGKRTGANDAQSRRRQ
ncbi:MAG: C39 family peptidase [Planctomycetota bacterium]